MHILQMPRQAGKTTLLCEVLRGDPKSAVVVSSRQEREKLKQTFFDWSGEELSEDRILVGRFVIEGDAHRGRSFSKIHIDNLDIILGRLGRLGLITTTYGSLTTGESR